MTIRPPIRERADELAKPAVQAGLRLDDLVREIKGRARIRGDANTRVFGVRHDSRRVEPGDLFVARRGASSDGTSFISAAIERGAVAVMVAENDEPNVDAAVPVVVVESIADGLAYAAAAVYGHPTFALDVIGVTGTNGKTTTTHLIRSAIDSALSHSACGVIGTVGASYGAHRIEAEHTTPEADELARMMHQMHTLGATHVAMEASSIAIALGRTRAVRFRVAAYTNLTLDHIDFHGSMHAYGEAKAKLFCESGAGAAVICVDDPFGVALAARVRAPCVRVSAKLGQNASVADIAPVDRELGARGIRATLRTPRGELKIESPLIGEFNLENIVVAIGVAHVLDLELPRAADGLRIERGAKGRMQRCEEPTDDVVVIVDYAHTPDALERVLSTLRPLSTGRILCVFGCGGDRDPSKRAPMGDVVARLADLAVITSDNPRTEDPAAIAEPIERAIESTGMPRLEAATVALAERGYVVDLDRANAIATAVASARPNDIVLIAGKGHEDYQIIGATKQPFDDVVHATQALANRRSKLSFGGA